MAESPSIIIIMLNEKDLQVLREMFGESRRETKEMIEESRCETKEMIEGSRKTAIDEAVRASGVMMKSYFDPQFELLAESIKDIQEKLVPRSRVDDLEDEVKFLKLMYRQMAERVSTLERAN